MFIGLFIGLGSLTPRIENNNKGVRLVSINGELLTIQ